MKCHNSFVVLILFFFIICNVANNVIAACGDPPPASPIEPPEPYIDLPNDCVTCVNNSIVPADSEDPGKCLKCKKGNIVNDNDEDPGVCLKCKNGTIVNDDTENPEGCLKCQGGKAVPVVADTSKCPPPKAISVTMDAPTCKTKQIGEPVEVSSKTYYEYTDWVTTYEGYEQVLDGLLVKSYRCYWRRTAIIRTRKVTVEKVLFRTTCTTKVTYIMKEGCPETTCYKTTVKEKELKTSTDVIVEEETISQTATTNIFEHIGQPHDFLIDERCQSKGSPNESYWH
ncbi:MAG: hypothetical protein D3915_15125 [Candidatus Electrothrix sp. AU1_5]|nr:hypothetical protein [Candidatus Electrothrix gigas]